MDDNKDFLDSLQNVVPFSKAIKNATPSPSNDLIAKFDAAAQSGTFWYGDFIRDHGITNEPHHKDIRGHLRKVYGFKTGQVEKHVAFFNDFGRFPETVEDRVEAMLMKCDASIAFNGVISATVNGRSVDQIETLTDHLHLVNSNYRLDLLKADIDRAVSLWTVNAKAKLIAEAVQANRYDATLDATEAWNYVARQHTRYSDEYTVAVYRKFIWQIKKKMLNQLVTYHLMPIILGPQGTGKSWFVKEILCGPMQPFIHNSSFESITDTKMIAQWSYPIQFTDEMAYASLADMDAVKGRITCNNITYRPMYTGLSANTRNCSTFIGASNKDTLANMIRDETGNRRFAPVYFTSVQGSQREAITFDPIVLWQSVDENGPDPMDAVKEELATIQQEQRHLSPIEQWLTEFTEEATSEKYLFSNLWDNYQTWKAASNVRCQKTKNDFFASLRNLAAANPTYTLSKPKNRDCLSFSTATSSKSEARTNAILAKVGVK